MADLNDQVDFVGELLERRLQSRMRKPWTPPSAVLMRGVIAP